MVYKILTVCGTGIATSTVAAEKCKQLLLERGLSINAIECKVSEIEGKISVFQPHVIVPTTIVSDNKLCGIKKFPGLPFITGIGMDKAADEIAEYLKSIKE
jgi:galactitol PTS system EIIB component